MTYELKTIGCIQITMATTADPFGRCRLAIIQEATALVQAQIILVLEQIIHGTGTHNYDTCPSHHNMALHSQNLANGYSTNLLFSRDKGSYKELTRGNLHQLITYKLISPSYNSPVTHICTLMSEKHLKPNMFISEVQISTYTHTHTHRPGSPVIFFITYNGNSTFHLFRVNTLMLFLIPLLLSHPHSIHKQVSWAFHSKGNIFRTKPLVITSAAMTLAHHLLLRSL